MPTADTVAMRQLSAALMKCLIPAADVGPLENEQDRLCRLAADLLYVASVELETLRPSNT